MAWLGRVSLGGFPDLAGAVTKLSESVKNIEKNFDSALGLEDKPDTAAGEASGIWPSASDRKALFDPVMAFMGHRGDDTATEPSGNGESSENISSANVHDKISPEDSLISMSEIAAPAENDQVDSEIREKENDSRSEVSREKENDSHGEVNGEKDNDSRGEVIISNVSGEGHEKNHEAESDLPQPETDVSVARNIKEADSVVSPQQEEGAEMGTSEESQLAESKQTSSDELKQVETNVVSLSNELCHVNDTQESYDKEGTEVEKLSDKASPKQADVLDNQELHFETDSSDATPTHSSKNEKIADLSDGYLLNASSSEKDLATLSNSVSHGTDSTSRLVEVVSQAKYSETANAEQSMSTGMDKPVSEESFTEVERLKKEMKQMEATLQGAAWQAQAKADEIARLMNENEQLKSTIEDLK